MNSKLRDSLYVYLLGHEDYNVRSGREKMIGIFWSFEALSERVLLGGIKQIFSSHTHTHINGLR